MNSSSPATTPSSGDKKPEIAPTASLDLRGEVCPYTFVRTKLRLEELPVATRLTVLVDHPPAVRNVPRSVLDWGQEVSGVEQLDPTTWAIHIIKTSR